MSEPQRRVGRPPKLVPDEVLHIRVSVDLYDRIARLALRVDKPVAVAARIMLERDLKRMEALLTTCPPRRPDTIL